MIGLWFHVACLGNIGNALKDNDWNEFLVGSYWSNKPNYIFIRQEFSTSELAKALYA